jgi:hypothetical protein
MKNILRYLGNRSKNIPTKLLDPDPDLHSQYGSGSRTAKFECGSGSTTLFNYSFFNSFIFQGGRAVGTGE